MNKRVTAAAVAFVSGYTVAFAHHGGSMYDRGEELVLEDAVVVELLFVNPHARLIFNWTDSEGTLAEWVGELSGSNELVRTGIYDDLVEPGERITVKGWRHRSIPRDLRLSSIVLPNGREVELP